MAEGKEKAIEKDQEIIIPAGAKKGELTEKELENAAGGWTWVKGGMPQG